MFERFTEKARRTIFFARYEASNYGSITIETEHLLLGILHEDKALASKLSLAPQGSIRSEISKRTPPPKEATSISADLPLSDETKQALFCAANESTALNHSVIGPEHLILGLLRIENCFAASLLRQHGVSYETCIDALIGASYREREQREPRRTSIGDAARFRLREPIEVGEPASLALQATITYLERLFDNSLEQLDGYSEQEAMQTLRRKTWSRKEALGDLANWAMAHQAWLARALTEPKVHTPGYPEEQWVSAQKYSTQPWREVVDLWACVNRLLIHVLRQIPEEKLNLPCRIGITEPIPLSVLINRYVERCEDVLEQILSRL